MNTNEWVNINDNDFENLLELSLSDEPPKDIVKGVTPWRKSMNRTLIGLALTTVHFNLFYLNYILPLVGSILVILGLRVLRKENKWFGGCFVLSVVYFCSFAFLLILKTTIFQQELLDNSQLVTCFGILIVFIQLICLWRGLSSVKKKSGLSPRVKEGEVLVIWYIVLFCLAQINYKGRIIPWIMLISYVLIFRALYKLSKELDTAGYTIKTTDVKIRDCYLVSAIALALITAGACGYIFFNSYPMVWSEVIPTEQSEVEEIKAHLISLDFPEYVLNDLTNEEILNLKGALQVVSDVIDKPVNKGRRETKHYNIAGHEYDETWTVFDVKEIRITGVGVQVPGEKQKWIIIHHFLWTTNPGFHGTEVIQLRPASWEDADRWTPARDITGRVLYDNMGKTFVSDYSSLGYQNYITESKFFGTQENNEIIGTFSLPRKGSNHRGYVLYSTEEIQDPYMIYSNFIYTHQRLWLQYPVVTAEEKIKRDGWQGLGTFATVMDKLAFYSSGEKACLLGG